MDRHASPLAGTATNIVLAISNKKHLCFIMLPSS
jgi:hypothetical protein